MSRETKNATLDPVERTSLAAAALINAVGSLMEQLVESASLPRQDIAARIGVTPARISQLLGGDGNVRISTLGRLVEACGATLTITATLRSTGESITVPRPVARSRPAPGLRPRIGEPLSDVDRTSLAAAGMINAVGSRMEQTVDLSGISRRDIAAAMGVTAGRVTQIVDGDGNVRVATLARVIDAAGADLSVAAVMRDGASINVPRRPTRQRSTASPRTAEVVDLAARRTDRAAVRQRLRELVPVRELVSRGILPDNDDSHPEAVCALLEIPNVWAEPRFAAAARRHNVTESVTNHQRAWLACARSAARNVRVAALDVTGLSELAAGLARNVVEPASFVDLPRRFAEVGVRLVHVEQFKGGKISGAAFRIDPDDASAAIALSGRGQRLDKVLFTLLHESAHVVLGHTRTQQVILDVDDDTETHAHETSADELAASWVLPDPIEAPALVTETWVQVESARLGIHPIVLVGRLQSMDALPWNTPLSKGAPKVHEQLRAWASC